MSGVAMTAALAAAAVVVSAAPRLMLAAGILPDGARPFVWSDLLWSYERLLAGGRVPYWDTVFYYPPLVGYVSGLFSRVTADPVAYLALWTGVIAVAAALVAAMLARATDARTALLGWALAPQLFLYSGANFDVLAIAFVVAAVLLARRHRVAAAVAALAVGAAVKVFPALIAPLELLRVRADAARAMRAALLFAAVLAVLAAPSVLAPFPVTAFLDDYAARVNFESAWGLAEAALDAVALGALVGPIAVAGLVATYVLGIVPLARRADPAVTAGLALATLLIWTRLYSPQYSLWMLPFFTLAAVPPRWPRLLVVADVIVFLTVYPLTLVHWAPDDAIPSALVGALAGAVALRHVALVGTWLALHRLGRGWAR